ncbi:phosphatidylinositol 3-kinase regulatory subunit [Holotrichia oblita]|uniref:Phosphatidylinositol 3-kinase regulatory subunit n=1 Tax=Holotrichia oblita TaxID=644536 RepID=A0ACB9TU09_HOLOL|nr:phosphatidylinositol 3-kinase regulatory subunit [Holotrichia oblita]
MESPPSTSTWSEAFILSDDSGLLLTSSSMSSGSMSGESRSSCAQLPLEFQDSDCEDKSLSLADSLDGMSDIICGENFNTLKKGPHWNEKLTFKSNSPIEPPLEFQDRPYLKIYETFAIKYADYLLKLTFSTLAKQFCTAKSNNVRVPKPIHHILLPRNFWSPELLTFSPLHAVRPSSRSSLGSSRLSSSHNSLSVPTAHRVDDSSFITQAVSHDTLTTNQISDLYNVPFDSDVYAVPVDTVKLPLKPKRNVNTKKRRRNTASSCREYEPQQYRQNISRKVICTNERCTDGNSAKRHSVAGSSSNHETEPIHMTLQEVRQYLQTLYSSSSDSSDQKDQCIKPHNTLIITNNNQYTTNVKTNNSNTSNGVLKCKKNVLFNMKNKKVKDSCDTIPKPQIKLVSPNKQTKRKKTQTKMSSFKQTFCNIFRFRRIVSPEAKRDISISGNCDILDSDVNKNITHRALPPLPSSKNNYKEEIPVDFATSIRRVKDCGWYWGPLSSEAAEKILSNEPDGSFIVRDSSDDHYIFSLTLKLNNSVRHVRIEHDQGNFSFGNYTKFKSQTIVEFIENAVEHSRSGRYLFFLHRRPTIGPVRVQLLHPVSRFKQIQSLQHMCRFVINKLVRKDLIQTLPLPRRMIDYLSTPHYYSEMVDGAEQQDEFNLNHQNQDPETESDEGIDRAGPENVNNETLNNYVLVRPPIINSIVGTRQS